MKIPIFIRLLALTMLSNVGACATGGGSLDNVFVMESVRITEALIDEDMEVLISFRLKNEAGQKICVPRRALEAEQTQFAIAILKDGRGKIVDDYLGGIVQEEPWDSVALEPGKGFENKLKFARWRGALDNYRKPLSIKLRIPGVVCESGVRVFWPPELHLESQWIELKEVADLQ